MNCLEDSDLSSSLLRKNQSLGSAVEVWLMPPASQHFSNVLCCMVLYSFRNRQDPKTVTHVCETTLFSVLVKMFLSFVYR